MLTKSEHIDLSDLLTTDDKPDYMSEYNLADLEVYGDEADFLVDKEKKLNRLRDIMEKIPNIEGDFIELYYFRKVKQVNIAEIFRVSQPMVCYRLKKGVQRIKFLLSLPEISKKTMEEDLAKILPTSKDVEIMMLMYRTTCESRVATILNTSQSFIRHRFLKSLEILKVGDQFYYSVMKKIMDNLNILRDEEEMEVVMFLDTNQYY